jgi:drug/metabolite transporter (DMT)-like permease
MGEWILCIIVTSYLTLAFKWVGIKNYSLLQTIIVNYWACVVTGLMLDAHNYPWQTLIHEDWFSWSFVMGLGFILLFFLLGHTTQKLGVAVATVSAKLSLVIPFLFSLLLYQEEAGVFKWIGICIAIIAVALITGKKSTGIPNDPLRNAGIFLPILLFLGFGLWDTLVKYIEQAYLTSANQNTFLITAFGAAAIFGTVYLLFQFLNGKDRPHIPSLLMGIAIGVPNYFSIWLLIRVLQQYRESSSTVIPVNNVGVVLFSTMMTAVLFKEKLSPKNRLGILMSVIAILLMAFF